MTPQEQEELKTALARKSLRETLYGNSLGARIGYPEAGAAPQQAQSMSQAAQPPMAGSLAERIGYGTPSGPRTPATMSSQRIAVGEGDPAMQAAQAATSVPLGIPGAQMPQPKKPGLVGRIRQKPGGSQALLAFGAHLLSNPDFFAGLGQGALAYQGVLDAEEEKLKPKSELIANGQFIVTYDPVTGKRSFERTDVATYETEQAQKKYDTQVLIGQNNIEGRLANTDLTNKGKAFVAGITTTSAQRIAAAGIDYKREEREDKQAADVGMEKLKSRNAVSEYEARVKADGQYGTKTATKLPPVQAFKVDDAYTREITSGEQYISEGRQIAGWVVSGKLPLGPADIARYTANGATATNTPGYAEYNALQSWLAKGSLEELNYLKGTATEKDMQVVQQSITGSVSPEPLLMAFDRLLPAAEARVNDRKQSRASLRRTYNTGPSPAARPAPKRPAAPKPKAKPAARTKPKAKPGYTTSPSGIQWK